MTIRLWSRQNINLLNVARNATLLPTTNRLQAEICSSLMARHFSHFEPIYTVRDHKSPIHGFSACKSQRWANTSSGSFAQSNVMANAKLGRDGPSHLTVFDDNSHLPTLPIPILEETLEKLKESVSPMAMNSIEFVTTLQLIDDFAKTVGPKFDAMLHNKAAQTKNWLTEDWWKRDVYFRCRKPLVINSSPGMIYPRLPFEVNCQQSLIHTISLLISGIIDLELGLVNGYNPESTSEHNEFHLDPNVCYSQYKHIFKSLRLPGDPVDSYHYGDISKVLSDPDNRENMEPFSLVLSYKGNFFEIKLADYENEEGRIDKLNGVIGKIISYQPLHESDGRSDDIYGPGVLTASKRDQWADSIKMLDQDSINAIKEAHFLVCLDTIHETKDDFLQQTPHTEQLRNCEPGTTMHKAGLSRQVLHSDPQNIGNRWFDKPIQLVVATDDKTERLLGLGINYEHSLAEGQVVSKLIEYSYDKTVQKHRAMANSDLYSKHVYQDSGAEFRQLRMFDETKVNEIEYRLKQARQDYCSQVIQFELEFMNYRNYGSNAIKSLRYSPDSWFQVALQLSYYNVHKRLGPCYESASTRRFALGRTETIRSLTKEVAQFCFEPNQETLQAAVRSHKVFANLANNGAAIDRVLMAYRWIFNELRTNSWTWGLSKNDSECYDKSELTDDRSQLLSVFDQEELSIISAFFNNDLIKRSNRYALSTSQVTSVHPNIAMAYGPLMPDGYGCCYNISGQRIVAAITANSNNQSFSCDAKKLHDSLVDSLDTMRDIAEAK